MTYQILDFERRGRLEYFRHMMERGPVGPKAYMVEVDVVIYGNPTIEEMFSTFQDDGIPFSFLVLQHGRSDDQKTHARLEMTFETLEKWVARLGAVEAR